MKKRLITLIVVLFLFNITLVSAGPVLNKDFSAGECELEDEIYDETKPGCEVGGYTRINYPRDCLKSYKSVCKNKEGEQITVTVDSPKAVPIINYSDNSSSRPGEWGIGANGDVNCGDIAELSEMAKGYYGMLVAITIVSLVAFTMFDFAKGVFVSDPEPQFKKAFKNLTTRVIIIVILLILPEILELLISKTIDNAETCITSFK